MPRTMPDTDEKAGTSIRIVSISAAQNKRGKNCFEGGMTQGNFTWYKDMGGNSNWMYLAVQNATAGHVSLALWLLYEAATEPLVDPLSSAGEIQVGFFNQSKNLNRQVPLFELAEESKPCLELASGEAATLKVRINDLSSHHQNQRFVLVAGPADAPIRGSRSVPIEIMSKPRLEDRKDDSSKTPAPAPSKRKASGGAGPASKRGKGAEAPPPPPPLFSALAAVTDPNPTPQRQADLTVSLLEGLPAAVKNTVAERLLKSLEPRVKMALFDRLAEDLGLSAAAEGASEVSEGDASADAAAPAAAAASKKGRFKSLAKAIVEFKRNELGHRRQRDATGADYALSEDELRNFFVDDSGSNIFDALSPRGGEAAPAAPAAAAEE
mmetsp:Transcript_16647/g.51845  ORF Transcript_16647/g.51845 Transcript_16647/m.51845 type:complete len:381 (-) Transcript_16647:16-1158(-)